MPYRAPKPRPADKIAAEFIRAHLGRGAFAPLTGTDWRAWHAFVHLVELWGVSRDPRCLEAMRSTVACAQTRHDDVMQVFVQTIPAMLDWCDAPERATDNYDHRIGKFYRDELGWRTYYTHPSLVDHRDEGSLVGHGANTRRVAHNFLGQDVSALSVDWSLAPAVGFEPYVGRRPQYHNPYRRSRVRVR